MEPQNIGPQPCDDEAVRVDAIFRGRFVTFDATRPHAGVIAVAGGRIVAIDDDTEGLSAAVEEDFGEHPVFPGFHDAHCHTTSFGLGLDAVELSSPPISSLEDLYAAVAEGACGRAPGEWIVGTGYDQNKLGGSHPDRLRLDTAAGGRPVWLQHTSGHMCMVNSAALAVIGRDALAAPIAGGVVVADNTGEPTGLLQERAQSLVHHVVLPRSLDELATAIGRAHDRYLAEGLTSVCDAGIAGGWIGQSPLELAAYQLARERGSLKVRTTVMIASDVVHNVQAHPHDGVGTALDAGIRSGLGDEWLRVGALKIFSDGSLIGRTCWMHDGFSDDAGNTGYPQADPEELRQRILRGHRAGWQLATHAIGDAAVAFTLDCYEEALRAHPRPDHRHRIEHCGITTDTSLRRIRELGVIPVPQGRFVGEIGDGMVAALGPGRVQQAYRLATFVHNGIVLPASSDRPVVDGRPLLGIADMCARRTESGQPFAPEEARSADEARRADTKGSAFAVRAEHERGSLEVGQLADLVVLADDPRRLPPDDIKGVSVLATVVGGEVAYRG
jgi:predicted amidohydrolase YtcJ